MSVTRIRYKKDSLGKLVSTKPVFVMTENVVVTLDPSVNAVTITKLNDSSVIRVDSAPNLGALKKKAKVLLKEMGAVFLDEVRRHRS